MSFAGATPAIGSFGSVCVQARPVYPNITPATSAAAIMVLFITLSWLNLFRRHAEQPAGIGVLEQPQRAVGADFGVANLVTDIPAFGRRRAALAVEGDAAERPR